MQDSPVLTPAADTLAELRAEIDRIDLEMHRLLMARGEIIDRLIAVKRAQGGGCAFRPDREAQMMRALVERHRGLLPVDAVEGVWRVIVSTFTYVQNNYSVHADDSGGDAQMRDSARFHFGFTVPYIAHHGASAVIDAVAASAGDLGVLRATGAINDGAWWVRLVGENAPKIIARLPFVERPDHPAGLPVFVVARPAKDAASRDILLYAINLPRWSHSIPAVVSALEGEILASAPHAGGLSLMVAAPGHVEAARFAQELSAAGVADAVVEPIGSHAGRYELNEARSGVFAPRS
ncbi:chorismate mutase [Methylocystis sp. WRRC1]|uniref:chorismate mutase n=1 Tax=unclassified Methylocystis TaxID=2625913 RepID=UPI0001F88225|nr:MULTISPECIES: chorismate mutase [unclassified Methylocystis]MCC3246549.1 chorismate mutase [Methylocystis sp. WRRC1]